MENYMTIKPQFPDLVSENMTIFINNLGEQAALFYSPQHYLRNGDAEYSYRQSSDILYLTGWTDPEMALLIRPKSEKQIIMFVQPKNPKMEIWTGIRPGIEGAMSEFGADDAFAFSELEKQLPNLLMGFDTLHYRFAENSRMDQLLLNSISKARKKSKSNGLQIPETFCDPSLLLHRQRLFKNNSEISILRKAADITNEAHTAAMAITKPGLYEYQLEAKISHIFRDRGGNGPGYTTIVGSGENAVILHYISNDSQLKDGDLVCIDAGCEYGFYTADVTRTWPINGKFTDPQKELYEIVLNAQIAAISMAKPGNKFIDIHNAAVRSLTESMIKIGFLEGNIEQLIADNEYKKWYMHGTSHWLGLDVHDVGPYVQNSDSILLEAGMVLTVEPGIYIAGDDESVPQKYRGIGIRIEDDILITENGNENLTDSIPKTVSEIESLVGRIQ
jgi:Xaa-Pro aminopeptidase